MIPNEWFFFQDWLKEQAEKAGRGQMRQHFQFVFHEWTSHIAKTIRERANDSTCGYAPTVVYGNQTEPNMTYPIRDHMIDTSWIADHKKT